MYLNSEDFRARLISSNAYSTILIQRANSHAPVRRRSPAEEHPSSKLQAARTSMEVDWTLQRPVDDSVMPPSRATVRARRVSLGCEIIDAVRCT